MKSINLAVFLSCSTGLGAYGWGTSGHQAVGYIAQNFLAPKALAFVKANLDPSYSGNLGLAANWADTVRGSYPWSSSWHYVDALDNPPSSCSVDQSRDCGSTGCILTAIANYTQRVVNANLDATQHKQALQFLDHFIGDIHQPLHVENKAVGGNDISVTCNGASTNLHSLWDSGMINILLANNYGNSVTTWVNSLTTRIKSGDYKSSASSWLSCTSPSQNCALVWAKDSNTFDCSYVFTYTSGADQCKNGYYTGAVPIIEKQIAKAGYRLAAWLNVLFDGSTNLP